MTGKYDLVDIKVSDALAGAMRWRYRKRFWPHFVMPRQRPMPQSTRLWAMPPPACRCRNNDINHIKTRGFPVFFYADFCTLQVGDIFYADACKYFRAPASASWLMLHVVRARRSITPMRPVGPSMLFILSSIFLTNKNPPLMKGGWRLRTTQI